MNDAAQKIAERVPLPEPAKPGDPASPYPAQKKSYWSEDQLKALRLAVAEEALRGAEAVLVAIVSEMSFDGVPLIDWHVEPELGMKLFTAPPAPAVDEAMKLRACMAYYAAPAWEFMPHKAECLERMGTALTAALHGDSNGN